jgi:hypothetical protein
MTVIPPRNSLNKPVLSLPGRIRIERVTKAREGRPIVEDYCPFPQSIEWQLGQQYLQERGSKAFLHDAAPVPFVINNDGDLSLRTAQLFFASLLEAEERGGLEEDLFVLELGIGVGLFARLFLDAVIFAEILARKKAEIGAVIRPLQAPCRLSGERQWPRSRRRHLRGERSDTPPSIRPPWLAHSWGRALPGRPLSPGPGWHPRRQDASRGG